MISVYRYNVMFVNTQNYQISVYRFKVMLVNTQNAISVYRYDMCEQRLGHVSSLSRLGWDAFLALVHDPHFSSRLKPCFVTDLGASGLCALCLDMASRRGHECRKKTVHKNVSKCKPAQDP